MQDMLVKLYELPNESNGKQALINKGFSFRKALTAEMILITDWVKKHFGEYWASEVTVAFSRQPITCFLAIYEKQVVGFACYETTCRSFFGPTGVLPEFRKKGIGKVLLFDSLKALKSMGYAYAIIGGVGPAAFYENAVGATIIENSDPGIYKGLLKKEDQPQ
jgi:GNAT superfamily N-acetyltransferase